MKGLVPPDRPCDVNGPVLNLAAVNLPAVSLPAVSLSNPSNSSRSSDASMHAGSAPRTDFMPPEESVRGSDRTNRPGVHFLSPTTWGFSGGANGCVWVGFEASKALETSLNPEALRRLFAEVGEERSRQSSSTNRNAETSADSRSRRRAARYPLPLSGNAASPRSKQARSNGPCRPVAHDALACLPALARALEEYPWAWVQSGESHGERASSDSSADGAAYRSAIALGRCRLLGSAGGPGRIDAGAGRRDIGGTRTGLEAQTMDPRGQIASGRHARGHRGAHF